MVIREKLSKTFLCKKVRRKLLMKLTPVVNFINILHTNFSYEHCFSSFFYVTREKLLKPGSYKKNYLVKC